MDYEAGPAPIKPFPVDSKPARHMRRLHSNTTVFFDGFLVSRFRLQRVYSV
jgi:hypothetical protein